MDVLERMSLELSNLTSRVIHTTGMYVTHHVTILVVAGYCEWIFHFPWSSVKSSWQHHLMCMCHHWSWQQVANSLTRWAQCVFDVLYQLIDTKYIVFWWWKLVMRDRERTGWASLSGFPLLHLAFEGLIKDNTLVWHVGALTLWKSEWFVSVPLYSLNSAMNWMFTTY